jgi:hypothetical protein
MRFRTLLTVGLSALMLASLAAAPAAAAEQTSKMPTVLDPSMVAQQAPDVVALDAGCADLRICVWNRADFNGDKLVFFADAAGLLIRFDGGAVRSAKNHFDGRAVAFFNLDRVLVRCLNPNTHRPGPFPDGTRLMLIGPAGSRC